MSLSHMLDPKLYPVLSAAYHRWAAEDYDAEIDWLRRKVATGAYIGMGNSYEERAGYEYIPHLTQVRSDDQKKSVALKRMEVAHGAALAARDRQDAIDAVKARERRKLERQQDLEWERHKRAIFAKATQFIIRHEGKMYGIDHAGYAQRLRDGLITPLQVLHCLALI